MPQLFALLSLFSLPPGQAEPGALKRVGDGGGTEDGADDAHDDHDSVDVVTNVEDGHPGLVVEGGRDAGVSGVLGPL